jgi:transposase-like protein
MKKTLKITQPSVTDFFASIPDEAAAMAYMESARWPNGVTCIHCGHADVWKIASRNLYTCKDCRKQFTIRTGTVMEASHIKVQLWVFAMYLMTVSRKGVSSVQLAKQLGITQKSAWFMAHRIRESCKTGGMLTGTVEADETYIGGKAKNMHAKVRKLKITGTGGTNKTAVFGLKSRDGEVRAQVIQNADMQTLHPIIKENVAVGSTLYSDECNAYNKLGDDYKRGVVRHGAKEYVLGDCHTNGMESHWALLKRAHMGTFHHWSEKHLPRYVDEFSFKQNTKDLPAFSLDGKDSGLTTVKAHVAGMEGRRLMYKTLTANA